jgi:acyl-CoA thioesterase-2
MPWITDMDDPERNVHPLFDLEPHGPDTFVGSGPRYPWGGLYGGQIVAQSLRAAAATVDPAQQVHSLRAYFIRRGDHAEPIRFEVDRIRNGRTFTTRRVVARQAIGAILNLESSFQVPEDTDDLQTVEMDTGIPGPDTLADDTWSPSFERRNVPASFLREGVRTGRGRAAAWMRVKHELGDDQLLHRCWLSYVSDDMPSDAVRAGNPNMNRGEGGTYGASLDHSIWFHREVRADEWHLYDFTCQGFAGARGLAVGYVFTADGTHVATVAQEVLMRVARHRQD